VGLLRAILASLVVGSHLGAFGGATFAVKGFFIISGFYMALVISTRYYALPVGDFYASRLLRLVPFTGSSSCSRLQPSFGWCPTVSNFTSWSTRWQM
jgi:hypothetical protein